MLIRYRRLRSSTMIRELVAETRLSKGMFIYPYFVVPKRHVKQEINGMPGIHHFSIDTLLKDVEQSLKFGINKILLFGVVEDKFEEIKLSNQTSLLIPHAVSQLRKTFGEDLYIITDVCACTYTNHGHCGILRQGYVQNDETVAMLAEMALSHAQAGVNMVAPSDMMDGRVLMIREHLNRSGFENTSIMSYSIKFASAYYGPFREAANSAPNHGDRKTYQMDYRNANEAMREAILDEQEGADILMVKPALAYLDIIHRLKQHSNLPIACYNVSGEYAMLKAAAQQGWINEQQIVLENMYAFSRAGANMIISYHAREILEKGWL